ncbi:MAG: hypothetical protein O7G86_13915 [Gammaproteobacteria bacterium]|nr:hypothetical protein [Gammaproteobacteria bacterium]
MLVISFAGMALAHSAMADHDDPLFESHDLLELTLHAPIKTINRKRDTSISYPAGISFRTGADALTLDVQVEVRGKNRRKRIVCKSPPLRLTFATSQTAGTVFRNQKKLKLVTQCDPYSRAYESYLVLEYLAYRILNEITPRSFNVRLARITYQDTDSSKSRNNLAFFIEHKKRLAKRMGAKHLEIDETSAVVLDSAHLNQGSLFQLLIGNVDWSATSSSSPECCHNYKLFQEGDKLFSIPYDFDLSGLVNAKYAKPDIEMGLKTIRDRRYRGYCRNNKFLEDNTRLFNARKAVILDLFRESAYLPERKKKSAISYVESFYNIVNNPKRVRRVILGRCHRSIMVEVPLSSPDPTQ